MKQLVRIASSLFVASFLILPAFVRAEDKPAATPPAATPAVKSVPGKPDVEAGFRKRHEGFLKDKEEALKNGPVQLLFVGDSITDGWHNGAQNKLMMDRWGKYNPLNIGIGGDRTEHVLWRLDQGEVDGINPKAVMLMIG